MSILKAVQDYLSGFCGMELRPIQEVLTDTVGKSPSSYALAPVGNTRAGGDILGNKTYTNNYIFYARECADLEIDRAENHVFLEALTQWLEEKSDQKDLPVLPDPFESVGLAVANAILFGVEDNGNATYEVQITLTYKKPGGINKWLT